MGPWFANTGITEISETEGELPLYSMYRMIINDLTKLAIFCVLDQGFYIII